MKRLFAAGAAASILLLLLALPAMGAELTGGCSLEVRSFTGADATGDPIDAGEMAGIVAKGNKGDDSNPFRVSLDGSVDFVFSTAPTVFQNNSWSIYAQGVPIPLLQGQDDNPLDVDESGVVNLNNISDALPFEVAGVFFIHGDLYGNDNANHCHGEGYVKVRGQSAYYTPGDHRRRPGPARRRDACSRRPVHARLGSRSRSAARCSTAARSTSEGS